MELKNRARIYRHSESKAVELITRILETKNVIRNKGVFDWLRGDTGRRLTVDAYFPDRKLVFEYQGIQHSKPSKLMDRRPGRPDQGRRYDDLRRRLAPEHGLQFLELHYDEPLEEHHLRGKLKDLGFQI
jgi:very-short-patch-repair endonuclease